MVTPPVDRDGVLMKTYTVMPGGGMRPDTPFSSYDYDSDEETLKGVDLKEVQITRETVVTVD